MLTPLEGLSYAPGEWSYAETSIVHGTERILFSNGVKMFAHCWYFRWVLHIFKSKNMQRSQRR